MLFLTSHYTLPFKSHNYYKGHKILFVVLRNGNSGYVNSTGEDGELSDV